MKDNSIFTKIISVILAVLIWTVMLWGEFAGIYHAFAHHGIADGFISVFIPPYSWYRSVDFIFYLARDGLTKAERDEIRYFIDSINLSERAFKILNKEASKSNDPVFTIDEEIEKKILDLLRKSLKKSQNVRDEILSKIHPKLPQHYRDKFCVGIKLSITGMEDRDPLIGFEGQWLLDEWGDWYNANLHEIRAKYSGKKKR